MSAIRPITQVIQSQPTLEGAGVRLRRAFGHQQVPRFDPFLLLDDFRGDDPAHFLPGFPWHPHRGIETITYMLEGQVAHGDSLGNSGVIGPGDVQWMTAGSGIIHQEMPQGDDRGRMGGFQLWANLPAAHKMTAPRYQEIKAADIPVVTTDQGARVRVICGECAGVTGPVSDIFAAPEYLDVELPAGTSFRHPMPAARNCLAYVFAGGGYFCREKKPFGHDILGRGWYDLDGDPRLTDHDLVRFGPGDEVEAFTEDSPMRFLLISGVPLGEPVAWHGPIVMNTRAELETAFREYQEGGFLRHRGA